MKKKKTKQAYRLRNWKYYNAALVQRGSLTLWVSDEVITAWRNSEITGKPGRPRTYSDTAVLSMATLKEVYHLPLRATQGLMRSIMQLLGLDLPVMDYSQLSRRCALLEVVLPRHQNNEPLHMVVDSTGVKVFGEGEWKVRQHGYSKRRTWRKFGEILKKLNKSSSDTSNC